MANRSYLYSINEIPGEKPSQTLTAKGLSEYNWNIPFIHRILIGGHPTLCDSIIDTFPKKISFAGEYDEGLANLIKFGELMNTPGLSHPEQFNSLFKESIQFLSNPENKQRYILLELAEIYDMDSRYDLEYVQKSAAEIAIAIHQHDYETLNYHYGESVVKQSLLTHWEESLGLDCWSNILYWYFPDTFKYSTPFKIK